MVARFCVILVILAVLTSTRVLADSFTASLSHNPMAINDTLQLTLRFEGQRPNEEPDLDPLSKNFTVAGVTQDQRVQIINGRYSGAYSWHVNLQAKRVGKFIIPPITLGKYQTTPIELEVIEEKVTPGQTERLSISVTSDKVSAYVGEQIILSLKLRRRGDVQAGGLKLSDPFDYQQLGEARDYSSVEKGIRYYNSELKLVVFSDKIGVLKIPSIIYEGKVPSNNRRPNFGGFFNNYRSITTRSKPLSIDIKPKPPSAPVNWLPSTNVKVTESWETDTMAFKQGQPVTWTIRVRAEGLKHESLPALSMPDISGIKWYPDQPLGETSKTDDGLVSFKTYKYALVPDKAGDIVLPQIQIPWWDTKSDTAKIAELASRTINVAAAPNVALTNTPSPILTSPAPTSANPLNDLSHGGQFDSGSPIANGNHWRVVSLMLLVLWLATLILFALPAWRQRRNQNQLLEDRQLSRRSSIKSVRRACVSGDIHQVKQALLAWGCHLAHDRGSQQKILNLNQLGNLLGDSDLSQELNRLDMALYSEKPHWERDKLINAIENFVKTQEEQERQIPHSPIILNPSQ